jgi:fumarylacetoacetase
MENLESWLEIAEENDFSLYNIPFGVYRRGRGTGKIATRIGDYIVDLSNMMEAGFFDELPINDYSVFYEEVLNPFIELGKTATNAVRKKIIQVFQKDNPILRDQANLKEEILILASKVEMLMPVKVGDYTDFYSSEFHARNVGAMFRGVENALLPNWKHMPIAYHGRASSILVSQSPVIRPKGQFKIPDSDVPIFGFTKKLDFEVELAFITGKATKNGESVPVDRAEEYIFGFVLFNDWSARDIQSWEYVPLGPFLGKNFISTISPWVVTLEALTTYMVEGPPQEPPVLSYLRADTKKNLDIDLKITIQPEGAEEVVLCNTNSKYLYWNMCQQLAHHTVNGCNINVGDVYASGTISGPEMGSFGSMLEITQNGKVPFKLGEGANRAFLEDGDTVKLSGFAIKKGNRVGFGEVKNKIFRSL